MEVNCKRILFRPRRQARYCRHIGQERGFMLQSIPGTFLVEIFLEATGPFAGCPSQNNPPLLPNTNSSTSHPDIALLHDITNISCHYCPLANAIAPDIHLLHGPEHTLTIGNNHIKRFLGFFKPVVCSIDNETKEMIFFPLRPHKSEIVVTLALTFA